MGGKITDKSMFAAAVAHPIRCRALVILADREASPVEISRELGIDSSHVAYHVRLLLEEGLIELVEETPRRGSIEHRYRAIIRPELSDEEYAALTREERSRLSRLAFCLATADANYAFSAGSFGERPDHHITRVPLRVDEEGWEELRDLFRDTFEEVCRIKREAGDRLSEEGEIGASAVAFNTFFELPPGRVAPKTFDWVPPS